MVRSHEDMMVQCQRGDIRAFELLVETYRSRVFNFIYRMVGRETGTAEDLLQEVFMKAYEAREYYEPRARFATWLFSIARNHSLNFLKSRRYRQGRKTVSLDDAGNGRLEQADPQGRENGGPDGSLKSRETAEMLEQAIAQLPDAYRESFVLHAVEGFSQSEVAAILNENASTVRSNYHRARQMLRERIGNIFAAEGGLT